MAVVILWLDWMVIWVCAVVGLGSLVWVVAFIYFCLMMLHYLGPLRLVFVWPGNDVAGDRFFFSWLVAPFDDGLGWLPRVIFHQIGWSELGLREAGSLGR